MAPPVAGPAVAALLSILVSILLSVAIIASRPIRALVARPIDIGAVLIASVLAPFLPVLPTPLPVEVAVTALRVTVGEPRRSDQLQPTLTLEPLCELGPRVGVEPAAFGLDVGHVAGPLTLRGPVRDLGLDRQRFLGGGSDRWRRV